MASKSWHSLTLSEILTGFSTDPKIGLSQKNIKEYQANYGLNQLIEINRNPWYRIFARQFASVLIWILLIAGGIALAIGEVTNALGIFAIVLLNALLGFVQEYRAEQAIASLKKMLSPQCEVLRDGVISLVAADQLVPGDIVIIETGSKIPADLRLIHAVNLKIDESTLTGESLSVNKNTHANNLQTPLAERTSMAFMGTVVTNGRGRGIVVEIGMSTEFGRIALLTQEIEAEVTPLQRRLKVLGKQLGVLSLGIAFIIAIIGYLQGNALFNMFFTAISIAVAVVPEGLPTVVIITMALGIRQMAKKKALLRRLPSAETLGSTTVICTDKTGTLTQNEMMVTEIWLPNQRILVSGKGYEPVGNFIVNDQSLDPKKSSNLLTLLETGLLCNHARLSQEDGHWMAFGEPTEAALITLAYKAGCSLPKESAIFSEFSFNSSRKRMTVITRQGKNKIAHVKGAPEVVLKRASHWLNHQKIEALTEDDRKAIHHAYISFAHHGLRTLALAMRVLPENIQIEEEAIEDQLVFLGIIGMMDPPRPEAAPALRLAKQAGVNTIMVTGDSPATALSIAKEVGIKAIQAITGDEFDAMRDQELSELWHQSLVFARTTPEHKLRLVSLLQKAGHVVAMTGDGINDAPALKKADVGIAMGKRGTDVAKSVSDVVLTDDNFASIIHAIEEGRRQCSNIKKFLSFMLASNFGETVAILANVLIGGALIFLPAQILWINLITDGLAAIALGVEPAHGNVMQQPPYGVNDPLISRRRMGLLLILGMYMGLTSLWLFHCYGQTPYAQTLAFSNMIVIQEICVLNFRSLTQPLFRIGFFSNPWILLAAGVSILAQVGAVYIPFLQNLLGTVPLSLSDWGLMLALAAPAFLLAELMKYLSGKKK